MRISSLISVPINYFKEHPLTPIQQLVSTIALVVLTALSLLFAYKWHQNRPQKPPLLTPQEKYKDYLEFLKNHPKVLGPSGDASKGEIQIITDPEIMEKIAQKNNRVVGFVFKDRFWTGVNDAVIFPSGSQGIYGRILWNNALEGPSGAAVMPILEDGRIGLVVNYRHATRSWECELPRGASNKGETPAQTAAREAKEETGLELDTCLQLGTMPPDSGLTITQAPVFMAKVIKKDKHSREDTEAIAKVIYLTLEQIKEAFQKEKITVDWKKKKIEANFRDPFLTFALYKKQVLGY